jgi:aminoglycoside phosphotransferase
VGKRRDHARKVLESALGAIPSGTRYAAVERSDSATGVFRAARTSDFIVVLT